MQKVLIAGTASFIIGFACLSVVPPVLGAEKIFDLRQAMKYSLEHNGELKALREERGVREAGKIKAGLHPNPLFELDGSTGEITGTAGENRFSIGISQEFLPMGKRGKRLRVAEKDMESFERQIDNEARILAGEVKTVFCDLLLVRKRVELAGRSVALNNQLLEITKQRLEAGDIPELEMNMARVEVARSEGEKIEAERDLFPAEAKLRALMGLPSHEAVTFTGSLETKPVAQTQDRLKMLALATRPDLKALEAEQAKGSAEIDLARAERIPNVTAGIAYQRENSGIEVGGVEGRSRDNLIGFKLSVPIPLFDRNQAGIIEAQARRSSAESRNAYARMNAEREVEAAYVRVASAERSLALYEENIIPQLEENLKLVREAYQLGEVGILTVIEEQKKFFDVNDSYLTALYNRRAALVKLETAVGADFGAETDGGVK